MTCWAQKALGCVLTCNGKIRGRHQNKLANCSALSRLTCHAQLAMVHASRAVMENICNVLHHLLYGVNKRLPAQSAHGIVC